MTFSILLCLVLTWLFVRYAGAPFNPPGNNWYEGWREWVQLNLPVWLSRFPVEKEFQAGLQFIVIALSPAALLGIVLAIINGWLWGLLSFLVALTVLLFSCGRIDYDTEMLNLSDDARHSSGDVGAGGSGDEPYPTYLAYASYDRWFAAAFWFLVFGPVLAIIYRCVSIVAASRNNIDIETEATHLVSDEWVSEIAKLVLVFLDWLPVRLWGLVIVLMGNFSAGWSAYQQKFLDTDNAAFLREITQASSPRESESHAEWLEKLLALNDRVMLLGLLLLCLPIIF